MSFRYQVKPWFSYIVVFITRSDRRYKEVQALMEEEKSNAQRLQDQVNSLNGKIRNVKRDKEECESEVETLQRKLRTMKSSLEEAEQENSNLSSQLSKLRAGGGASSRSRTKVC